MKITLHTPLIYLQLKYLEKEKSNEVGLPNKKLLTKQSEQESKPTSLYQLPIPKKNNCRNAYLFDAKSVSNISPIIEYDTYPKNQDLNSPQINKKKR